MTTAGHLSAYGSRVFIVKFTHHLAFLVLKQFEEESRDGLNKCWGSTLHHEDHNEEKGRGRLRGWVEVYERQNRREIARQELRVYPKTHSPNEGARRRQIGKDRKRKGEASFLVF